MGRLLRALAGQSTSCARPIAGTHSEVPSRARLRCAGTVSRGRHRRSQPSESRIPRGSGHAPIRPQDLQRRSQRATPIGFSPEARGSRLEVERFDFPKQASDELVQCGQRACPVFTAAFLPDQGDSILSLGTGFRPSDLVNHLVFNPFPFAYVDPAPFPQIFAQGLSPRKAAELNAGQIPINAVSGADLVIDPAEQHWMASRAGAIIVQFDDASHAGGFTHYAARFVKLVEQAAGATAG
jgi:hypothetical protein